MVSYSSIVAETIKPSFIIAEKSPETSVAPTSSQESRDDVVICNLEHPFAVGVTLKKLSAITVDDKGNETFISEGTLDHIRKKRVLYLLLSNVHGHWEMFWVKD